MTETFNYNIQELNEIFNPLDRSQERLDKIIEYLEKHAKIEYWEQTNGNKRRVCIEIYFPYHPSPKHNKYYWDLFLYEKSDNEQEEKEKGTRELFKELANRIFSEN